MTDIDIDDLKNTPKVATINTKIALSQFDSIIALIDRVVMRPDANINIIERLLTLLAAIETQKTKREFYISMAITQSQLPKIIKNAKNDQTRSRYATIENVIDAIVPIASNNGFSISFGNAESNIPSHYKIICDIDHIGGFSKKYDIDLPADATGIKGVSNKTNLHAHASTISYGRRYLLMMIFNIATTDDDDGNAASRPAPVISEHQLRDLQSLIADVNQDHTAFIRWAQIDHISEMPASLFDEAMRKLNVKRERAK